MTIQYYSKKNIENGGSIVENVDNFTFDKNIDMYVIYREGKNPLMIDGEDLLNFIIVN